LQNNPSATHKTLVHEVEQFGFRKLRNALPHRATPSARQAGFTSLRVTSSAAISMSASVGS
jgi:hypothetical protein